MRKNFPPKSLKLSHFENLNLFGEQMKCLLPNLTNKFLTSLFKGILGQKFRKTLENVK